MSDWIAKDLLLVHDDREAIKAVIDKANVVTVLESEKRQWRIIIGCSGSESFELAKEIASHLNSLREAKGSNNAA